MNPDTATNIFLLVCMLTFCLGVCLYKIIMNIDFNYKLKKSSSPTAEVQRGEGV